MDINILFIVILLIAIFLFCRSIMHIAFNIRLGIKQNVGDQFWQRLKTLILVAICQSKMTKKPLTGIMHIFIYAGFILVIIEMLEILFDGISGSHRAFCSIPLYPIIISGFECIAILIIVVSLVFLLRRNIMKLKRFHMPEITGWPRLDANIILITQILLMVAFITMNAADLQLQSMHIQNYPYSGTFIISSHIASLFSGITSEKLVFIERFAWWFHIIGVLAFFNYVPYSKHLHIILSFPNVFFSRLKPLGYIFNMQSVNKEVRIAMGLINDARQNNEEKVILGAKDVAHLSRKSLMDAYSCTECGRCTDVCPANLSDKKLSPRKIMMDTRDRLEEYGKIKRNGTDKDPDKKTLLYDYISEEEIWACTTCNACTYECPVQIEPVKIIMELRRYLFMEGMAAPSEIKAISTNIENNGSPWELAAADRDNWTRDLQKILSNTQTLKPTNGSEISN